MEVGMKWPTENNITEENHWEKIYRKRRDQVPMKQEKMSSISFEGRMHSGKRKVFGYAN